MTEVVRGEHPRPDDASASPSCRRCDANRETFSPALGGQHGGIVVREAQRAPEGGKL